MTTGNRHLSRCQARHDRVQARLVQLAATDACQMFSDQIQVGPRRRARGHAQTQNRHRHSHGKRHRSDGPVPFMQEAGQQRFQHSFSESLT